VAEEYRDPEIGLDGFEKTRKCCLELLNKGEKVEKILKIEHELERLSGGIGWLKVVAKIMKQRRELICSQPCGSSAKACAAATRKKARLP